jgi:hypothetical protein
MAPADALRLSVDDELAHLRPVSADFGHRDAPNEKGRRSGPCGIGLDER